MTDDQPTSAGEQPNSWQYYINEAKAGNIRIRMDLEEFVHLDRACEALLNKIETIKRIADGISKQQHWGLGEDVQTPDGKELISGKTLVKRFREKARGSDNSVYAVMESHRVAVEGIQELFRQVRQRMTDHDAEAAARYQQLEETLPKQEVSVSRFLLPCTPDDDMVTR